MKHRNTMLIRERSAVSRTSVPNDRKVTRKSYQFFNLFLQPTRIVRSRVSKCLNQWRTFLVSFTPTFSSASRVTHLGAILSPALLPLNGFSRPSQTKESHSREGRFGVLYDAYNIFTERMWWRRHVSRYVPCHSCLSFHWLLQFWTSS